MIKVLLLRSQLPHPFLLPPYLPSRSNRVQFCVQKLNKRLHIYIRKIYPLTINLFLTASVCLTVCLSLSPSLLFPVSLYPFESINLPQNRILCKDLFYSSLPCAICTPYFTLNAQVLHTRGIDIISEQKSIKLLSLD